MSTDTFRRISLWDPEFCHEIIKIGSLEPAKEARLQEQGEKAAIRSATGYGLDPHKHPNIAIPLVNEAVSNPWGFKLYADSHVLSSLDVIKYTPGDHYKSHTDWGGSVGDRKISATIQLSSPDEYEGGDLLLYDGPEPWTVDKKQGTATFFPSWTLHEVKPITEGERWALVCFFCGPAFT